MRRVKRDLDRPGRNHPFKVSNLEFHECSRCGERLFTPQAVRIIQAASRKRVTQSKNSRKPAARRKTIGENVTRPR